MQRMDEMARRMDEMARLPKPDKKQFEEDYRSGFQPNHFKAMKELISGVVTPSKRKPLLVA